MLCLWYHWRRWGLSWKRNSLFSHWNYSKLFLYMGDVGQGVHRLPRVKMLLSRRQQRKFSGCFLIPFPGIKHSIPDRYPGACCDLRSEEHTSELQSRPHLVCRLLLEKKKK